MKKIILRILTILTAVIMTLSLGGAAIYVYLFYPRAVEPFEYPVENPSQSILIATQGSDFKNAFVLRLCNVLQKSGVHIKGIDLDNILEIKPADWDRIIIINSFLVKLNHKTKQFIARPGTSKKTLIFITSGGNDWQPQPSLTVDTITSASRKENINDLINLIVDWSNHPGTQDWQPSDYILALSYLPGIDVNQACQSISSEILSYQSKYPDLRNRLNRIGYYLMRLNKIESAITVFRLNVEFYPESWNVYDSLGEALLTAGDRSGAVRNYQKALDLNPASKSARSALINLES